MKLKIGLDIGGTKCAISTGECEDGAIKILSREEFPTAGLSWQQVLEEFACRIEHLQVGERQAEEPVDEHDGSGHGHLAYL